MGKGYTGGRENWRWDVEREIEARSESVLPPVA
jgi:hypothetical protein